jgi:hypothetical protein
MTGDDKSMILKFLELTIRDFKTKKAYSEIITILTFHKKATRCDWFLGLICFVLIVFAGTSGTLAPAFAVNYDRGNKGGGGGTKSETFA